MVRAFLACSVAVLIASTAGCRMCASPYDDCSPTYVGGDGCGQCSTTARAGSILSNETASLTELILSSDISDSRVIELEPTPADPEPTLADVIEPIEPVELTEPTEPVEEVKPAEAIEPFEAPMPSPPPRWKSTSDEKSNFDEVAEVSSPEQLVATTGPPAARWTARRR